VKGGEEKPRSGSSTPTLAEGADPLDPLEGIVRDPGCDEVGRRSEQAVAALDVGIEKAERSARLQRLHPEGPAELNGHRVDIDAVEAAADDVAQGSPGGLRRRLVVVCSL
jgi:hypothetical protein